MWSLVEDGLRAAFRKHPQVAREIEALEIAVEAQQTTPGAAARDLLERFLRG
jgi:LAO/AO transport system kinase